MDRLLVYLIVDTVCMILLLVALIEYWLVMDIRAYDNSIYCASSSVFCRFCAALDVATDKDIRVAYCSGSSHYLVLAEAYQCEKWTKDINSKALFEQFIIFLAVDRPVTDAK